MHVAYLMNIYPYATTTFIRREILELEKLGFQVSRIAARRPDHPLTDEADRAELGKTTWILANGAARVIGAALLTLCSRPGRFVRAFRLAFQSGMRSDRGLIVNLAYLMEACAAVRFFETRGVEHVHAHFATNATAIAMLSHVLGGPTYSFTVHGPEDFDLAHALSLDEKIGRAEFVVAISHFARSQLFRWCKYEDWSKIQIVRCGVSEAFLRTPLSPPSSEPRFLSIGRLSREKGQLLLVEAAHLLDREGASFSIDIIGDGEMRKPIEELIARYVLGDKVRLLGWQPESQVRERLAAARVFLLPSFAEGLPVVLMEALALGRPVITTTIAGVPELVEAGVSGWLVPAGSVDALVAAMREVLATPVERLGEMGRRGAAVVARQHDIATEAGKLAELYKASVEK